MSHFKANLRDIEFGLFEWLGVGDLLDRGVYGDLDRSTVDSMLNEVLALATGPVAASYVSSDREPVGFDHTTGTVFVPEALRESVGALNDAGWSAVGMPPEMGGADVPAPLRWAIQEMLMAANRVAHFYNLGPLMHTLLFHEGTVQQRGWAVHAWKKRWGGTMALTEHDAGSDVGMCTTTASPMTDGNWHLKGTKRFISGGDLGSTVENIMHLVLARPNGAGPGTKGLSLFVVPKYLFDPATMELGARNGVRVTGLEHKMGIRSAPTCEMSFGADSPAVGYLVGDIHNGIAQMFRAIENARMGVGAMATGTLTSGYLHALGHAKHRVQGADLTQVADKSAQRVPILKHPSIRRSLILQKAYAEGLRALYLYCAAYQDPDLAMERFGADADLARRVNDLLLPVVKGVAAERAFELLNHSLQVFGGSGYLQDHPLEQYVRDTRVDSLYEGTTAVQAQDFFFRKLVRDGGVAMGHVAGLISRFAHSDQGRGRLRLEQELLGAALAEFWTMATKLSDYLRDMQDDLHEIYKVGLTVEGFLLAAGDLIIGWLLLEQAATAIVAMETASECDKHFYSGKVAAARWFASDRLPRIAAERALVDRIDTQVMYLSEAAF